MNKVGLITIHDTRNYGSLLQTFSLYKAIESLGVNIELIDYKCKAIVQRENTYDWKSCKTFKDYVFHFLLHKKLEKQYQNMWSFIRENMKVSISYNKNTIKESNLKYDTFIVGSDIVWGMNITGRDFSYLLDFADKGKRKLSFASSVGTKWREKDENKIQILLQDFDRITVREQIASEWIRPLVGHDVPVTCDPTMLWDKNFWGNYAVKHYDVKSDKYVLVYMTTGDQKNVRDAIAYGKRHKMKVYYIYFGTPKRNIKCVRPQTVGEWIGLFANAHTVFTASYHGLLFSLYFNKDVFYYNRGNKSRMISLGKELCITHREGLDENIINNRPIDWTFVNEKIAEKRAESLKILKSYFM